MNKENGERITVVGSGLAGMTFLRKVKELNPQVKATLIDRNDFYFPKTNISINPVDLKKVIKINKWADDLGIDFISATVDKVNEKKKKIFLKDQKELEFDNLVIATGALSKKIGIKGTKKEGFFYPEDINPYQLKTFLKIYNESSVLVNSCEGIKFSLALKNLQEEVRVIAPSLEFLGPEKDKIINILEKRGIIIYQKYSLEEVIGEKTVKAIKITKKEDDSLAEEKSCSMKVFSSQLVFADSGLRPNLDFLNDGEIRLEEKDYFKRHGQIYIIGDAANLKIENQNCYFGNQLMAEEESNNLANYLLKDETFEPRAEGSEDKIKKEIQAIYDKEELWQNGLA